MYDIVLTREWMAKHEFLIPAFNTIIILVPNIAAGNKIQKAIMNVTKKSSLKSIYKRPLMEYKPAYCFMKEKEV